MSDEVRLLFRDAHVVAVDKPAGLLVHRTRESTDRRALLQEAAELVGAYLYPVHRIDRAASGVVLFGLSPADARALHEGLADAATLKEYLVLCRGATAEAFASDRPLSGKAARTEFRRLAPWGRSTLLRARLRTGRRHQIRRHLAHLAHQVIGDTRYGKGRINRWLRETYGLPRMALHAERVRVAHPRGGAPLELRAPLADDLRAFLARLPDGDEALLAEL